MTSGRRTMGEGGGSGDRKETKVPGKVATSVAISEENVYHDSGKEEEKGLETKVF